MTMPLDIGRAVRLFVLFSIVTLNSRCNGSPGWEPQSWRNRDFELTIIHISDIHARFHEVDWKGGPCRRNVGECIGGLPRVLTASNEILRERSNTIFLNAGDNYQGTVWYTLYKWEAIVKFLNMLPIDVMTIGNHDFDDGIDGLVPFLKRSKTPAVLCNVDTDHEPKMKKTTYTGKLHFTDEIDAINSEAAKLKEERVNIIIVLSHCGVKIDRIIAHECPDVDVIVGGHDHVFHYYGKEPRGYDKPVDEYPIVVTQPKTERTVLIAHASAFTKYLGDLRVKFDGEGEVVAWNGNPIRLDRTYKEDYRMLQELKPYIFAVEKASNKVIGTTDNVLYNDCRFAECNIGNMITDAMVASYIDRAKGNDWTYASIAINHAGAIKGSINPGVITYGDIIRVHSYDDRWDVIELQGRHLYQILEESFSSNQWEGSLEYKSNLIWSGIYVIFNTAETKRGIVDVKVRCQNCVEPKYEYLQIFNWYRIVVPSFSLRDSSSILGKEYRKLEVGRWKDDALVEFIQKMSPLRYQKEGRVHFCDRLASRNCRNHENAYDKLPNMFHDYASRKKSKPNNIKM